MKKIEIVKAHKQLKVGDTPNVDDAYSIALIKKGIAKEAGKPVEKKN